jgi:hypothetical protein
MAAAALGPLKVAEVGEVAESGVPWWAAPATLIAGLVPFTLLGGWGEYGDHSIVPWIVGFAGQFGAVAFVIALLRRRAHG